MSTVVIKIAGTDITTDVMFSTAMFKSSVGSTVGEFTFTVRDDAKTLSFRGGQNVTLDIDGTRCFDGYIVYAKQRYAFPVTDTTDITKVSRMWDISGNDINVLFHQRVVFDQTNPAAQLTFHPKDTADTTFLNDLKNKYLTTGADNLTFSFSNVGTSNPDRSMPAGEIGDEWGQDMAIIAQEPGAVWGIRPNRQVYYEDDNTENAPFSLSDQPNNTTSFGYSDLEWLEDGSNLVNDALIWGYGQGSSQVVYNRVTDATSLADHGRWQNTNGFRADLWRQTSVNRVATSTVYGSPQHLHGAKDPLVTVTCKIRKPGLVAGKKVRIVSNVFGLNDVYPLRYITTTFPTKTEPLFELYLSREVDLPANFYDRLPIPVIPGGGGGGGGQPPPPPNNLCFFDTFDRTTAQFWSPTSAGLNWFTFNGSNLFDHYVDGDRGWVTFDPTGSGITSFSLSTYLPGIDSTDFVLNCTTGGTIVTGAFTTWELRCTGWSNAIHLQIQGDPVFGTFLDFFEQPISGGTFKDFGSYSDPGTADITGGLSVTFSRSGTTVRAVVSSLTTGTILLDASGTLTNSDAFGTVLEFDFLGPMGGYISGQPAVRMWLDDLAAATSKPKRTNLLMDDFGRFTTPLTTELRDEPAWGEVSSGKGVWLLGNGDAPFFSTYVDGVGHIDLQVTPESDGRDQAQVYLLTTDVDDPLHFHLELDVQFPTQSYVGNGNRIHIDCGTIGIDIYSSAHASHVDGGITLLDCSSTDITVSTGMQTAPGSIDQITYEWSDGRQNNSFLGPQFDGIAILDGLVHISVDVDFEVATRVVVGGVAFDFVQNASRYVGPGTLNFPPQLTITAERFVDWGWYYDGSQGGYDPGFNTTVHMTASSLIFSPQNIDCSLTVGGLSGVGSTRPMGQFCETLTASVEDPRYYLVTYTFLAGTTSVKVDGVEQRLGIDYIEAGQISLGIRIFDQIEFLILPPPDATVYCCYMVAPA